MGNCAPVVSTCWITASLAPQLLVSSFLVSHLAPIDRTSANPYPSMNGTHDDAHPSVGPNPGEGIPRQVRRIDDASAQRTDPFARAPQMKDKDVAV